MTQEKASPQSGTNTQVKRPSMYKVILLNDDFTPMDFVITILQKFFSKTQVEATQVMLQVHHDGAGVAGIFSREIAEMKVNQVNDYARKHEHPLKSIMEREDE